MTADPASLKAAAEAGDPAAQFAYAQALAAQRQQTQAQVWLRRSADAGHPVAQALLGARMLTGETTPEVWREGVDLIIAAHKAGIADASNMLAGLIGMGADTPERWTEALNLLQTAAERGSNRGRAQLLALAREHGSAAKADDWGALRAAISLDHWTRAPALESAAEVLSVSPYVAVVRQFVSPAICAWMIERARGRATRALVYDAATGLGRVERDRNNAAFQVSAIELDLMIGLTRARIGAVTGAPLEWMEPAQILSYQVGETFAPHFDFLDATLPGPAMDIARRGQRATTFLIYLNEDFEGGETDFPTLGLKFRGRPGDAILFHNLDSDGEPDRRTRHTGLPPTRGEKWLFSQWIRNRAPTPTA